MFGRYSHGARRLIRPGSGVSASHMYLSRKCVSSLTIKHFAQLLGYRCSPKGPNAPGIVIYERNKVTQIPCVLCRRRTMGHPVHVLLPTNIYTSDVSCRLSTPGQCHYWPSLANEIFPSKSSYTLRTQIFMLSCRSRS